MFCLWLESECENSRQTLISYGFGAASAGKVGNVKVFAATWYGKLFMFLEKNDRLTE